MRGTRQVFFAVVTTTIVLISVFAPLMFMAGYTGRLFRELAVAVAASIGFSALLALSLSPMLSSKLLRPAASEGWLARKVDAAVHAVRASYRASLEALLGPRVASIGAGVLVLVLGLMAGGLFLVLPKELVPSEDRGRVDIMVVGPEGAGYDYTLKAAMQVEAQMKRYYDQGVASRYMITVPRFGNSSFNGANAVLALRPWNERTITADQVAQELNRSLARITGVRAIATVQSPLQRGGPGGGGNSIQFIAVGDDYAEIVRWLQPILTAT